MQGPDVSARFLRKVSMSEVSERCIAHLKLRREGPKLNEGSYLHSEYHLEALVVVESRSFSMIDCTNNVRVAPP